MLNKILSAVLIVGQLGFAASAMAAGRDTASSVTPELMLFTGSLELMGRKLSPEETQTQLSQLFSDYEKSSPQDGQAERIEQAMVAMNIYTPEQAHQLTLDVQNVASSTTSVTENANAQSAADELNQLLSTRPAGAQFSACTLSMVVGIGGAAVGLSGGGLWIESNTTNHFNSQGLHQADPFGEHVGEILVGAGIAGVVDAIIIEVFAKNC